LEKIACGDFFETYTAAGGDYSSSGNRVPRFPGVVFAACTGA